MAIYKTAKGKEIDMGRLAGQNELSVAVSNVKINARGDELGPGGQIIRKQPEVPHVPSTSVPVERHSVAPTLETKQVKQSQPALITPVPVPVVEPTTNTSTLESQKPNVNKGKP